MDALSAAEATPHLPWRIVQSLRLTAKNVNCGRGLRSAEDDQSDLSFGERLVVMRASTRTRFAWNRSIIGALIAALVISSTLVTENAGASVKPKGTAKNYSYPVLVKEASSLKGQRVIHTACIFQFDSNTGTKDFLAEWTNLGYGDWENDVNAELPSASVGAKAFQGDVVTIRGYILGNLTYQTEIGGSNTVPNLEVTSLTVVGHNCS